MESLSVAKTGTSYYLYFWNNDTKIGVNIDGSFHINDKIIKNETTIEFCEELKKVFPDFPNKI